MQRASFLYLAVVAVVCFAPQIAAGQSGANALRSSLPEKSDGSFSDWPKMRQDVQLLSGNSSLLGGLNDNQIQVFEDGVRQPEVSLQPDPRPVSICLILDLSGSQKVNGKALIAAAEKMISAAKPTDKFALVTYQGPVNVEQEFTSDATKLDSVLEKAEFGGPSDLFDAVSAVIDYLKAHAPSDRRVVVVISDGGDNYSHVKNGDLLRRLRHPEAPVIYSLSPPPVLNARFRGPSSGSELGIRNLLALSQTTGGLTFAPEQSALLNAQAIEIMQDIHSRYSLEYTSTHVQRDGKLHKVEIQVAPEVSASKVKAYLRQEYYAPSH